MSKAVLHKATTRGHANHGWLDTYHTFSFASYYNPERVHFGVLRVLNDDKVSGGRGFGAHPHDNMEIISIPLEGGLKHQDSMGNTHVIQKGDVQIMSAGSGIRHSEYNNSESEAVNFLQIWVFPNKKEVAPRYQQMSFQAEDRINKFQQVLSPNPDDDGIWIHQDAWFHLADLKAGFETTYELRKPGNGVYIFVLEGEVNIEGNQLNKRDGYGIWETDQVDIKASLDVALLIMEVPMALS